MGGSSSKSEKTEVQVEKPDEMREVIKDLEEDMKLRCKWNAYHWSILRSIFDAWMNPARKIYFDEFNDGIKKYYENYSVESKQIEELYESLLKPASFANLVEKISPLDEGKKNQVSNIFEKMDKNQDGEISGNELTTNVRETVNDFWKEHAAFDRGKIDEHLRHVINDGKITKQEFDMLITVEGAMLDYYGMSLDEFLHHVITKIRPEH